jgi:hypothetical protein
MRDGSTSDACGGAGVGADTGCSGLRSRCIRWKYSRCSEKVRDTAVNRVGGLSCVMLCYESLFQDEANP